MTPNTPMPLHTKKRPGWLALLSCITLTAIACAHSQAPAASRISIAVAPIGFGPESGLTPEEQAECEFGKELFEELNEEAGQSFAFSGVGDPRGVAGIVLVMRFARVEGMSGMFGTKRIVLEGQMLKDGNVTASFTAIRDKGRFGNSRGFQTTCSIMEDVVEELAEDVGKWLYKPTMNVQLGDLSPR